MATPDFSKTAPASREEMNAALSGPKKASTYPLRKAAKEWLAKGKKKAKAAWLKGS